MSDDTKRKFAPGEYNRCQARAKNELARRHKAEFNALFDWELEQVGMPPVRLLMGDRRHGDERRRREDDE